MARKKVTLAWISNDATRRATLKKRRKGLLKKVKELSILCDVRACALIYSPHEPQPEVWPSASEATRILSRFRAMPEMEQCKKMMNQETFLRQRVAKLQDQLRRHDRENRELESAALLRECMAGASLINSLRIEELAALAWVLDHKMKAVQDRIDRMRIAAALEGPIEGDEKLPVAVECMAVMPMLLPATVVGDQKLGASAYHEAMRWEQSYTQMGQLGGVGEGSGGGGAGDQNVLTATFVEQNQGNWESFFPY